MLSHLTLRRLLLVDAAVSGATGLLMVSGAALLHAWLDVPVLLIRYAGLALIPFALLVVFFARSPRLSATKAWTVIAMNGAWVVASVLLLVSGWIDPNAVGVTFVLGQALAVAGLAEFQYSALRARSW